MSCLCCADLREELGAIKASLIDQGFAFVRIEGELKLMQKTHFDCAHKNTSKTKSCWARSCGPAGCDDWEHVNADKADSEKDH